MQGVSRPNTLAGYRAGRPLEEALTEAHAVTFPP
jgi:hypothetical protein